MDLTLSPEQVALLRSALTALNEQRPNLDRDPAFLALLYRVCPECKPD